MNQEQIRSIKQQQLTTLSGYRKKLYDNPQLRNLFLELTLRCNARCFHCGSSCGADNIDGLPLEKYREILDEVRSNFDISRLELCITGGEPLLYKDFFELMDYAVSTGYTWGMTSNGTLIDSKTARRLRETRMRTISISIDGLEETHDRLRGLPGGWRAAMAGIQNLIDEGGFHAIQATTVLNHSNIGELEPLYEILKDMDIDSWRVIGLEPIGRARDYPDLMLTADDQRHLFSFIKERREEDMPVTYGCSHYLGLDYEREVRKWYFLCNAGVYTASITASGDITACLDIERNSWTIQGNVFTDSFTDVWKNRFEIYRKPLSSRNGKCSSCPEEPFCAGGSCHSWDFQKNEQQVCFKDILF